MVDFNIMIIIMTIQFFVLESSNEIIIHCSYLSVVTSLLPALFIS